MNKLRRKLLRAIIELLVKLNTEKRTKELTNKLKDALSDLETALDDEQDAIDNLPESLQWSTKASDWNDNIDNMMNAQVDLESIVDAYESDNENPYESVKEEIASVINDLTEAIER